MEAPIPPPLPDDEEDVSWALSTSSALWGRGERAEALKWLRRAAEHASDVNADSRALHLFKAAADISTRLSNPPAAPSTPAPSAPPPSQAPARSGSSAPPLPPGARRGSALMNATLPSATARQLGARLEPAPPPPPPQKRLPTASKPPLAPRSLQPAGQGQVRVTHARTMQSADADALATTIRREPASEAASRQPAGRGAAPTSQARTSDSRAPSPEAADSKAEPKPVGRRRNTDSGRKKTVDERLKRETEAAASRVRLAPKNERFTSEDEVTQTRSAASLVEAATAAAAALGKYDDLDEDTRVLAGSSMPESETSESVEAELDRAVEDLAGAPETVVDHTTEDTQAASATETAFAWSHTTHDGTTPDAGRRPGAGSARDARAAVSPVVSVAMPSTERAAPIPVLAAVRVAVLPGNAPGEARLVVLDGVETPPAGAVHAVLLPLTSADGASILRLLGG